MTILRLLIANPCLSSPCYNGGQCYYYPDGRFYCACISGYTGTNCQTSSTGNSYNPCVFNQLCANGGTCSPQNNQNGYICACPSGYSGLNCQTTGYIAPSSTPLTGSCGISPLECDDDYAGRIVGGTPVVDPTWPWIVSLQLANYNSHFVFVLFLCLFF